MPVIGWREWISLPKFGIKAIKAKIDTGARTSSLHAFDVTEFRSGEKVFLRFKVKPMQDDSRTSVTVEAPLIGYRKVRSSSGKAEIRPVIKTTIRLKNRRWRVEVTLARRDAMGFRMLLGRQAVKGRFVVDPSRSFTNGEVSS
ncbi:MAG: ATP-dependent zinc protease [Chloroflexi bacterium]|nr:ATP-dependent zinc protease [Chloroflexota bacterium]